jgi:hypothetical protein
MKLAMSVELEDLRFAVKQIVDLKSLTDDQHHQVYMYHRHCNKRLASALECGGVLSVEIIGGCHRKKTSSAANPRSWLPWNPHAHPYTAINTRKKGLLQRYGCVTWI